MEETIKVTIKESKQQNRMSLKDVDIQDHFWSEYIRLVREVVVPYQWEALNDRVPGAEPSHAIRNFRIAAGEEQGEFYGMVFQDSDVAKWLEAVGYLLETQPDPELEKVADEVIELIERAQHPDGYLNTYYTLKEPGNRWTDLCECHELYCAGHMIEAGVAYYQATGKRKLLNVVCRFADYIDTVFGDEPGKLRGYDGHQEIELALVKLYHATGQEKYLKLSQYFLDERGRDQEPHYYDKEYEQRGKTVHWGNTFMIKEKAYSQAHMPVREQDQADGHAVRAVYMLTGMAEVAAETGDARLLDACRRLWRNIVDKRMYITGGIGSMAHGEAFSFDYDLPPDTAYAETCASIGLIFFAQRMLQLEPKSEYADVMERALYNTVVSGMSQDGKSFFYVNPLEVNPHACGKNKNYDHVKPVRQGWFGCACCPPNVARLLASLGSYIYTVKDDTIYTHLYVASELKASFRQGQVTLKMTSDYPQNGSVQFTVATAADTPFTLALRIPDWSDQATLTVNGTSVELEGNVVDGYVRVTRTWTSGDVVQLELSMPILRVKGHPLVRHTAGKVALQRGPFVYCLEEADNGDQLHLLELPREAKLEVRKEEELLGGLQVIVAEGRRMLARDWDGLYRHNSVWTAEPEIIRFIPYYAWANRGMGEMLVWVREV